MSAAGAALVACQPQTVIVEKEKVVKETVEVQKEVTKVVEVEKEVTKIVEKEKEVTKVVERMVTPTALPTKYNESPVLSAKVASGELSPVDERMAAEPLVVYPYEEIGEYGGTFRVVSQSTNLFGADTGLVGASVQPFLRIAPNLQEAVPNTLKDWQMSDDLTTITCFMRRGLKWSDGEPVTADDMMFWYEDVLLNEEITPRIPTDFRPGEKPMRVEKIDDYTFRMQFAVPNPAFVLANMAHTLGFGNYHFEPAHYVRQFHITYNPKAKDLATEAGFDEWFQNYGQKRNPDQNAAVPTLRAYVATEDTPDTTFLSRNPYFWQMDSEGNQLPYVDEIAAVRVADLAMQDAKIISGQLDFAGFSTSIQNYSTYDGAAEAGNYRIVLWKSGKGAEVVYQVNLNYPDDVWRNLFQDVRFRRALSLAIDRDHINEVIYFGRAEPRQITVIPESKYFKEDYARAWADHDPDQANALLDELELKWDAEHKLRMLPNGEPTAISFEIWEAETPKGPITELITEYWKVIGIELNFKSVARQLLQTKISSNDYLMCLWHGDSMSDILLPTSQGDKWFVGSWGPTNGFAPMWSQWTSTNGEAGEEPPDWFKQIRAWKDEFNRTLDREPIDKILAFQAENLLSIGTVGNAPHPLIVSKDLHNVAETGVWAWDDRWSWPYRPEQWFFKQG